MLNTPHKADCGPEIPTTNSPREHQVYVPLSVPVLPPSPDHVDHALSELNQVPRHPGDVRPVDAKVLNADVEGGAHLVLDGGELAKEEKLEKTYKNKVKRTLSCIFFSYKWSRHSNQEVYCQSVTIYGYHSTQVGGLLYLHARSVPPPPRPWISNVVRRIAISAFFPSASFPLFGAVSGKDRCTALHSKKKGFFSSLYRRRGTPIEESHKNLKPCERRRHDCGEAFASRFDPKRPPGCLSDL